MNSHLPTLLIALMMGLIGGYFGNKLHNNNDGINSLPAKLLINTTQPSKNNNHLSNPFQKKNNSTDSEYQMQALLLKIEGMQIQIEALQKNQAQNNAASADKISPRNTYITPDKTSLTKAGISPDVAEDILRRIGQQDYRRLQLQNLIQRSNSAERRKYNKELRQLNKNKISLRGEMGDESYDQYLYSGGQNNRVKVRSVISNSPAETSGFEAGDVILTYDNKKILAWPDIRAATIEGEIGSYTNVEILRDGEKLNLMVPRGTLGVQLDATLINPDQ